jgi:SRSO17 transposase
VNQVVSKPPTLLRRPPGHEPQAVKALAMQLPANAYQTVTWREGSNAALSSRFAALRVRPAHRDYWRSTQRAEEWVPIEWTDGDSEPLKYFLSMATEQATPEQLVFVTKMRWRIERDYQDLKQEFGLGHYEGRGWRGLVLSTPSTCQQRDNTHATHQRFFSFCRVGFHSP